MLERIFRLKENNTTLLTEARAGTATFLTMSYIIFVQPAIMSQCGMDYGAVMVATCVSSAFACIVMGLWANYPIALAPAMGHNAFFAFIAVNKLGIPWPTALGAVFISGTLFLLFSAFGLREAIVHAIPASLKSAIAVGIGLLISLVGLEWAGLIQKDPATFVTLGDVTQAPVLLALFGLFVITVLVCLRWKGAILYGILATAVVGLIAGIIEAPALTKIVSRPPNPAPTFLKLDIWSALGLGLIPVIFIFFFLDLFDTIGTLVGVAEQGGFMKDGKLPRARQALASDAVGTMFGAAAGTSTITSYIESAAGVSAGGKTGLANMFTALLMLVALFFSPIIRMAGSPVVVNGSYLYPIVAPALIMVGFMMMANVARIEWKEPTEAIPAFLTIIMMPFSFRIIEGIAFGFISYSALNLITGKGKRVHWVLYVCAVLLIVRYAFLARIEGGLG